MTDLALPYVLPHIENKDLEYAKYRNLLMALQARRNRDFEVHALPFDLTIDLTTSCQLHCPYCAVGNETMSRTKLIMKDSMYARILQSIGEPCFIIWYFSTGEPLLHKRFADLVATSKDREIFSVISTNLSLRLSDESLTKLLTCGLGMISVSIDGATPESYVQYRRGGDFNLVADNVRRLVEIKKKLGATYPLIEWRFLRFRHNEHEEALARELAEEWGVDLLEFWGGAAPPEDSPHADGVYATSVPLNGPSLTGPALDRLAKAQAERGILSRLVPGYAVGGTIDLKKATPRCDWLYYSGMIYPDGRVGPCCIINDQERDFVQSVADYENYSEVYNSPMHVASRRSFVTGEKAGTACDTCPNPPAQHYQFRMKMRGILRNAPDWVVKILVRRPDHFFTPEDVQLIPEVRAIYECQGLIDVDAADDITARLRRDDASRATALADILLN